MRFKPLALALALTCLGGAAACSSANSAGAGGMAIPEAATTVKVENLGFLDMDVYVTRVPGGPRIRLGTANSNMTTTLKIPSDALLGGGATSLRFVADPIGGSRRSVSSQILVSPGDEVTLMIPAS